MQPLTEFLHILLPKNIILIIFYIYVYVVVHYKKSLTHVIHCKELLKSGFAKCTTSQEKWATLVNVDEKAMTVSDSCTFTFSVNLLKLSHKILFKSLNLLN